MLNPWKYIIEGNPLNRVHQHIKSGRHFAILSAQRSGLTKEENNARHKELKRKLTSQGYGHREVDGHWEGGKEKSVMVFSKGKDKKTNDQLHHDMDKHGEHYDQDSVFHHDGKHGNLHGTNETGDPGKNNVVNVGKVVYNKPESPYQTETKPKNKDRPWYDPSHKTRRFNKQNARFNTE